MKTLEESTRDWLLKFRQATEIGTLIIMHEGARRDNPEDEIPIFKAWRLRTREIKEGELVI